MKPARPRRASETEGHGQTAKAAQRGFSRLGPSGCDAGKKVVGRKHDAEAGRAVLDACADGPRGRNCAAIVAWQQHWPGVIRFFAFPAELRRIATAPRSCCAKPGAARSERAATFRTTTPRSSSCSWFRTAPQTSGRYQPGNGTPTKPSSPSSSTTASTHGHLESPFCRMLLSVALGGCAVGCAGFGRLSGLSMQERGFLTACPIKRVRLSPRSRPGGACCRRGSRA